MGSAMCTTTDNTEAANDRRSPTGRDGKPSPTGKAVRQGGCLGGKGAAGPSRGKDAPHEEAPAGTPATPEQVQKLELLAEIRATTQRLDRLRENHVNVRREKSCADMIRKPIDELQKIKKSLDAELAAAETKQDAETNESARRSRFHSGSAEEFIRLSSTAMPPTRSEAQASSSGGYPSTTSAAKSPAAPAASAATSNPLQLALEDHLILLGPDILCDKSIGVAGLEWDNRWASDPAGPRDEGHRRQVRLNTREKVRKELGLEFFGESANQAKYAPPAMRASCLFRDVGSAAQEGMAPAGDFNLLGRYDVCCVKTCADLDRKWSWLKGQKMDFWVAHAAAVNIGESVDAADFEDFQKLENEVAKTLDEWKYIEAMGHIMDNIVSVCAKLQIKQMVFFPFGMGAFLRHLGRIDANFIHDEEMQRLRRALAVRMVDSWAKLPKGLQVHLCLQFSTEEAQRNADAFLRAIVGNADLGKKASPMKDRVVIIPEGDALNVASDLAVKSDKVLLVNGANRQLIGNHWFASRAKMAIDENLHRRSWRLAATAYMLNEYDGEQDLPQRQQDTLVKRVKQLGGTVVDLNDSSFSLFGKLGR